MSTTVAGLRTLRVTTNFIRVYAFEGTGPTHETATRPPDPRNSEDQDNYLRADHRLNIDDDCPTGE